MKFKIRLLCIIISTMLICLLSSCDSKNENGKEINAPLRPITNVQLNNDNTTLTVGERLELDYTIKPSDTDEELTIRSGNDAIVEVVNNTIIAKSVGETWINIKASYTKNNQTSDEIRIKVINELNFKNFESQHLGELKRATVSVYCKRYNKNWIGKEKDVYIVSGKGTIVKSNVYAHYFLTDKTIFDKVATNYSYEEWYIIDHKGAKYSISGIQYHENALIGIGMFSSTMSYPIAKIYDSYAYKGDYAISLFGSPFTSRIKETKYYNMDSSTLVGNRSYVLYHEAGLSSFTRGEAIYNQNGEIIGINMRLANSRVLSVSSIEIRELFNGIFNPNQTNGGPIDII